MPHNLGCAGPIVGVGTGSVALICRTFYGNESRRQDTHNKNFRKVSSKELILPAALQGKVIVASLKFNIISVAQQECNVRLPGFVFTSCLAEEKQSLPV